MKGFLINVKGAPIIQLITFTTAKTRKGAPEVKILTCQAVQIGADYNKKFLRATGHPAGGRKWGAIKPQPRASSP